MTLQRLLWIDSRAGLAVGVTLLVGARWLSPFYGLPLGVVLAIGAVNLLYGSFSYTLWRRGQVPRSLLRLLVVANASWTLVCLAGLIAFWQTARVFGLASLAFEGLFVGALALLERTHLR